LGSDEVSGANTKPISAEESIRRYATLTGIPELNLPISLPGAASGVSMHEYRVVDGGCAQASGAVHLTSRGIRVLSATTNQWQSGKGHAHFWTWPLFMPATTYSPHRLSRAVQTAGWGLTWGA